MGAARVGQKLRSAILLSGGQEATPHNGQAKLINCRGLGTCGTCAVEVIPRDGVEPLQWTAMERARLNFPPHGPPGNSRLRLACQVRLSAAHDSVEVVKRSMFWGQGDDVVVMEDEDEDEDEEDGDVNAAAAAADKEGEKAAAAVLPFGALEFVLDADEWKEGGALNNGGGDGGRAGSGDGGGGGDSR